MTMKDHMRKLEGSQLTLRCRAKCVLIEDGGSGWDVKSDTYRSLLLLRIRRCRTIGRCSSRDCSRLEGYSRHLAVTYRDLVKED